MANTIDYATKVENGGATASGKISADDANEIKTKHNALVTQIGAYKKYHAWFTQTGVSAPTVQNETNSIGVAPSIAYGAAGLYVINFTGIVSDLNKIEVIHSPRGSSTKQHVLNWYAAITGGANTVIYIKTWNYVSGAFEDAQLTNTPIEIRIYD